MATTTTKPIRAEIIDLLRGRYATPVLSSLDRLGVLDALMSAPCSPQDFPTLGNKPALIAALDYLVAIGLLLRDDETFTPTALGRHVLPRAGSASIMESYDRYFSRLPDILTDLGAKDAGGITVDRPVNIHGSGRMHKTKFFPKAFDMCRAVAPSSLIDLGCGDGTFLEAAAAAVDPRDFITGVDLSPESTATTAARLARAPRQAQTSVVTCDAFDVAVWAAAAPAATGPEVISAWFVLHEFSAGSPERLIDFFHAIHHHRPTAHCVIGELVDAPPDLMAANRDQTIMPEFLLFHALSGQAPLSWDAWQHIRAAIPYKIGAEHLFDTIEGPQGRVPSNFIWCLSPV